MSHTTATANRSSTGPRRRRIHAVALAAAVSLTLLLTACGTGPSTAAGVGQATTDTSTTSAPPSEPTSDAPTAEPSDGPPAAVVARATGELRVYETPGDQRPTRTLPPSTDFGTPTVALVAGTGTATADGWLEVLLPVRPNGATGWVRAADVELRDVPLEVRVDLDARELVVLDADEVVLTTATAIGEPSNPTPTGRFYVVDKLQTPNPGGAYGPYALGLSAHSETLTEFGDGDGQVGIHGTNAPASIGRAVSHGCLRVENAVIDRLAHLLPLGTPVTIS